MVMLLPCVVLIHQGILNSIKIELIGL